MLGSQIQNRYLLTSELQSGGISTVYRGWDNLLARDVAIKMVRANQIGPDTTHHVLAEARLLARLEDPGIVPIYDFVVERERFFIVMKLMGGGSLAERLQRQGPLSLEAARQVYEQIGPTIDRMHHQHKIIHLDLKPANILMDEQGSYRIADFGLAQALSRSQNRVGVGTAAYMSPEQANQTSLTYSSDLYTLGVILFELLTGKVPDNHRTQPLEPLHRYNPKLPNWLQGVVEKAMAKKPPDRYPTATSLVEAMKGPFTPIAPTQHVPDAVIIAPPDEARQHSNSPWIAIRHEPVNPSPVHFPEVSQRFLRFLARPQWREAIALGVSLPLGYWVPVEGVPDLIFVLLLFLLPLLPLFLSNLFGRGCLGRAFFAVLYYSVFVVGSYMAYLNNQETLGETFLYTHFWSAILLTAVTVLPLLFKHTQP